MTSERKGMLICSNCGKWYHTCCFSPSLDYSFELSLLECNLLCYTCIVESWRVIRLYLYENVSADEKFLNIVFTKFNDAKKHTEPISFELSGTNENYFEQPAVKSANRGFQNKKSNCWAAVCLG